jgi:AcrR family transcriptional regulator
VPRWEPDAVGRLQSAAFELFADQGFDHTTVAEITERAGLTKRTFFNHFADKREVLFGPISELQQEIVAGEIAACADTLPPLDAVVLGLQVFADTVLEERRAPATRRQEIIEANPELQERELSKWAALTDTVAAALQARGLDSDTALLTARAGMLVQQTAMQRWTQPTDDRTLRELLSDALLSLRAIAGHRTDQCAAPAQP